MKIILIFIFLILILLYAPISIEIEFYRKNNNNDLEIKIISIYGISKIQINIPMVKLIDYNRKLALRIKNKIEVGQNEKDIFVDKNIVTYKQFINIYKNFIKKRKYIRELADYIIENLEVEKIVWISNIGTSDAFISAITCGILLQIKSFILSYLLNKKEIKEIDFAVHPSYKSNKFDIIFDCIIKIKLVHIIIAGIKGFKYLKVVN
ncbi:DUF2953 domain-containing protein [Caloranaerobacter azorensis]|uniref:DUF2953 domain-containing protein n=2 Tax=Caloranaerobacter azorensis TaxID=116090 RepID=A0A096BKT6_9FIRM|nr:DUF2953 domain-containing protein [Caloranaerobacter azorensis]KGG81393.1 hypothetical protein Y919_00065 [Caloranaerobacter azorensis H53214]QIB26037.1 DUF2953 domain-containing protein [Caloranaerobacter azorensis]